MFHSLKSLLKKKGYSTNVGDEGGFAPSLRNVKEAMDLLLEATEVAGFKAGKEFLISLDASNISEISSETPKTIDNFF